MQKMLLLADHPRHAESLRRIFHALAFEVASAVTHHGGEAPGYVLAVIKMPMPRMESAIIDLKRRGVASKLLALVPLDGDSFETRLSMLGADDVLVFPVTRARLELTVQNLMRIYMLERAGNAVLSWQRSERAAQPDHAAYDPHVA